MFIKLKYIFLVVIIFFITGCGITSPQLTTTNFKDKIDLILRDSIFDAAQVGIKVVSLKNNRVLYSKNEKLLLRPASNLKLITSAAALSFLKDTFQFRTEFYFDSLTSSLFIKGSGNPLFTSEDIAKSVSQLKSNGLQQINGNVVGDISIFDSTQWGEGWMWDDEPFEYAAYNSPLTINNNCIKIITTPSNIIGGKLNIQTFPQTSFVNIINDGITSNSESPNNLNVTRKFYERSNDIVVKGNMKLNSSPDTTKLTVLHPEKYFVTLLYEELLRQGITIKGKPIISTIPNTAKLKYVHFQSIDSVLVNFNKVSDNLTGENLLKLLGKELNKNIGTTKSGINNVYNFLNKIGIDTSKFLMVDGSGMSHYNLVTAEMYIKLLRAMYNDKNNFQLFYKSLPIGGVDGTLSNRMKNGNAFKNVHAKTGSIGGVSTLSGYVTTSNNDLLAFSIMMQNFIGSAKEYRNAQDKICEILSSISDSL